MLLFLLVQHDGIHFIRINHDNFEFILIFEWQHSWESETRLVTDKLGREAGPSCFRSDGLSHCQNDADCRDLSILSTCYMVKKTMHPLLLCELKDFSFWSEIIGHKLIEVIHFNQVISYIFSCENRCCLSETRLGQFRTVSSAHLLIDCNRTPTIKFIVPCLQKQWHLIIKGLHPSGNSVPLASSWVPTWKALPGGRSSLRELCLRSLS